MERHLSAGVATIVALMAACRTASGRSDIPFDPVEDADFSAEHVASRDQVGDWLLSLARQRTSTGKKPAAESQTSCLCGGAAASLGGAGPAAASTRRCSERIPAP